MTFVSPLNSMTLDRLGNVLPNAILLADVDSNKNNELLIGTQEGELLIYKALRNHEGANLWRRANGLGFITAVAVGFIAKNSNEQRPIVCVANAEGAIHLFLIRSSLTRSRVRSAGGTSNTGNNNAANNSRTDPKLNLNVSINIINEDEQQQQMQIAFSQQLICNPKILLIQDFNENEKQLIIAYCDRTIRIYTSTITEDIDGRLSGRFILKYVYNVAEHIYTMCVRRLSKEDYELIVSQPNGNLVRFNPNEENARLLATEITNPSSIGWTEAIALENFCDEVVYAVACNDRIDIFSNHMNKILIGIPLGVKTGYLCGLHKGPMTNDNRMQLVTICSVDGDTFITDRFLNIIRFRPPLSTNTGCGGASDSIASTHFCDQIQAFTCGLFGDSNMFCFIYVLTHNDKIIIVHSIETTSTKSTNLSTLLKTTFPDRFAEIASSQNKLQDLLHCHN